MFDRKCIHWCKVQWNWWGSNVRILICMFFFIVDESSISFGTTELIVIASASALCVWLFVGLALVCYRFLTRNSDDCVPYESPSNPSWVLPIVFDSHQRYGKTFEVILFCTELRCFTRKKITAIQIHVLRKLLGKVWE